MSRKTKHSKQASAASVIIYGLTEGERPRAARFDKSQAASALLFAQKAGFQALYVVTKEVEELASRLEPGNLFVTGKGTLQPVSQDLYDKILEIAAAALAKEPVVAETEASGNGDVPSA